MEQVLGTQVAFRGSVSVRHATRLGLEGFKLEDKSTRLGLVGYRGIPGNSLDYYNPYSVLSVL